MLEKSCDVLVLGAGGSGLVAAVRAAEQGCRVIVLEKAKQAGGAMRFASTMRTFGSKWQADRGIPDQSNAFLRKGMDGTYWKLDPQVVSRAILATGEYFDWYSQYELPEVMEQYYARPYIFDIPVDGQPGPQIDGFHKGSGAVMMDTMLRRVKELGVELLLQTPATDAEVTDGVFTAVLAEGPDGPMRITFRACIIASGSWICRKDVIEKVLPAFNKADLLPSAHENPVYTGDAIEISEKIGALVDWDSFCLRIMGPMCALGDHCRYDSLTHIDSIVLVDLNARRFAAEPLAPRLDPHETGHVLLNLPKARSFFLYSANTLQRAIDQSRDPDRKSSFDVFDVSDLPDLEELNRWFREDIARGSRELGMADTLEELAEQIGLDPVQLAQTVAEYNASCANGFDERFFKEPEKMEPLTDGPFYALGGKLATDGAFGGVKVNADMQAYAADGSLLEGVYVTGDFATGRHINLGGVKKQALNDMSWALASGYIAGGEAAKYCKA